MSNDNDRSKILEMLRSGKIDVDEASRLLDGIGKNKEEKTAAPVPFRNKLPSIKHRSLCVDITSCGGEPPVHVAVPFGAVKIFGPSVYGSLPPEVRKTLSDNNIDISAIVSKLDSIDSGTLPVTLVETESQGKKIIVSVK